MFDRRATRRSWSCAWILPFMLPSSWSRACFWFLGGLLGCYDAGSMRADWRGQHRWKRHGPKEAWQHTGLEEDQPLPAGKHGAWIKDILQGLGPASRRSDSSRWPTSHPAITWPSASIELDGNVFVAIGVSRSIYNKRRSTEPGRKTVCLLERSLPHGFWAALTAWVLSGPYRRGFERSLPQGFWAVLTAVYICACI